MASPIRREICKVSFEFSFGYALCSEAGKKKLREGPMPLRRFMLLNSVLNAASILLSPLVGVIRIIAAIITYFLTRNDLMESSDQNRVEHNIRLIKNLMAIQIGRGLLEICCLGPLLGIADIVVTLKDREMLCFKKA